MLTRALLFFFLLSAPVTLGAQTSFRHAVDYNDFIIGEQTRIGNAINGFNEACGKGKLKQMNTKHAEVLAQIKTSLTAVKALKPYKHNTAFRDAAIDLFEMYESVAANEYMEIIALMNEGIDVGNNRAKFIDVLGKIDIRSKKVNDNFLAKQKAFAEEFGLKLEENKYEQNEKAKSETPE